MFYGEIMANAEYMWQQYEDAAVFLKVESTALCHLRRGVRHVLRGDDTAASEGPGTERGRQDAAGQDLCSLLTLWVSPLSQRMTSWCGIPWARLVEWTRPRGHSWMREFCILSRSGSYTEPLQLCVSWPPCAVSPSVKGGDQTPSIGRFLFLPFCNYGESQWKSERRHPGGKPNKNTHKVQCQQASGFSKFHKNMSNYCS